MCILNDILKIYYISYIYICTIYNSTSYMIIMWESHDQFTGRVHICIWTINSSPIWFQVQFLPWIYPQMSKKTQKYFLWFLCIFTDICSYSYSISFHYLLYEGLCICFCPKFGFQVEEALTSTLALPNNLAIQYFQVLKGQVSRYCRFRAN